MKFDYYIFIDYSEGYIGYNILEYRKMPELLPKISRLRHYKDVKRKKEYLRAVKRIFLKEKIIGYFLKTKMRRMRYNLDIFSEVAVFLKTHRNCLVFISVDNNQYNSFRRIVKLIDSETILVKESDLKKDSPEYRVSLVIDNLLNLERVSRPFSPTNHVRHGFRQGLFLCMIGCLYFL